MTPEGKVKASVKRILAQYGEELDPFWPVQNGMGTPALDCIVCYRGHHTPRSDTRTVGYIHERFAAVRTCVQNRHMADEAKRSLLGLVPGGYLP